jgi:hypothetical protein
MTTYLSFVSLPQYAAWVMRCTAFVWGRGTAALIRSWLVAVSGHCHCATAIRGQSVSGSAITTCRRFDCVFGDGVRISKYFPRCCGEKSPARGSGFRVRLRTLGFLRNAAYSASVREMLSRINSDPIQQINFRISPLENTASPVVFWPVRDECLSRHDRLLLGEQIAKDIFHPLPTLKMLVRI